MNIKKMESDLKMENFYFKECMVDRKSSIEKGGLILNLRKNIEKIANDSYSVELTLTICKEKNDLNVKVVAIANFSMQDDDAELVKSVMNTNTVAIMFPFIRSQVSLLTTQPGMTPIILPPINTTKFNEN